jgi:hypothetical protein
MARIRIERVPIAVFNLGLFGFDHLQLVYQNDDTNERTAQDGWYVMEGLRDAGANGVTLGVEGWDGMTTLAEANAASGDELVAKIGTPTTRGSREVAVADPFSSWQRMAVYAEDIASQDLPYIALGLPGSPVPTINSSSVIASLLYYAGVDMQTVWPSGTRFSPGTTTLIGTSGADEMKIEQGFTTLVAGKGDDVLEGSNDTSLIDKFYGGTGDDVIHWSTGFNIIHGGQPSLDYAQDGTDTVDYTGVGEVLITLNKHAVPHRLPTFFAVSEQSRDWLFSIERLEWNPESDHIRLGKGVELLEENLTLKLGMEGGDGKGDVLDFAEVDAGLLFNASDDGALYVTAAVSESDAGLWAEEADWLVA